MQVKLKLFKIISIFFVAVSSSLAATSNCPENYYDGIAPDIENYKMAQYVKELCSPGYGVFYSGLARAPLWSAENLTPGRIEQATGLPRSNNFSEDTRLPEDWRNKLSDFVGSGYDRGHMAPAGDMRNPAADSASFLLSNIIAQDPNSNRNLWAAIEAAVRALAAHRQVFVITGPLWLGSEVQWLRSRVMVPTHTYKLVYDPVLNQGAAYLTENASHKRHKTISIQQLRELAGIDFLPNKSPKLLKLPRPRY